MVDASNGAWGQLKGLKVVEFAHVVAGPMAGSMLADQGADVVHVEPPGEGDAARAMGPTRHGVPLWFKVAGRNKRSVTLNQPDFAGEWVDLALFEPLFRLIEWQVIVHDQLGTVPGRSGNQLAVAPAAVINTYRSRDAQWITVTSATRRSVLNVVRLLGLAERDFATTAQQHAGRERLDDALRAWVGAREAAACLKVLADAEVVASKVFTVADIADDPIYDERGDIITIDDAQLGPVRMQGVIPQFRVEPGQVWRTGPELGADNDLVYRGWLGLEAEELRALREQGVI
jgi:formyl-CoA transferase